MSDRVNRKLERTFGKGLHKELKALGKKTLAISKQLVPVASGHLKSSGYIYHLPEGWTIIYFAAYASDVEEGSSAGPVNYTMNVKHHVRRLASGKVTTVSAHKKEYKNHQRPKQLPNGDWRIIADTAKAANYFLTDAWSTVRSGVKDKSLRNALPVRLSKKAVHGLSTVTNPL